MEERIHPLPHSPEEPGIYLYIFSSSTDPALNNSLPPASNFCCGADGKLFLDSLIDTVQVAFDITLIFCFSSLAAADDFQV